MQILHSENPINRQHPLAQGLVGMWLAMPQPHGRTGYQTGAWLDLAGSNHGTLTNGPTWSEKSWTNAFGSLLLDATDDVCSTPLNITTFGTVYSAAVWLYFEGASNTRSCLNIGNHMMIYRASIVAFGLQRNAGAFEIQTSTVTPVTGTWYRFGVTNAGNGAGDVKIYVNGNDVSSGATAVTTVGSATTSIGKGQAFPAQAYVANAMIWKRPLSAAEMKNDYLESLTGFPNLLNWVRTRKWFGTAAAPPAVTVRRRNPLGTLLGIGHGIFKANKGITL